MRSLLEHLSDINERSIEVKRKYGEHSNVSVGKHAPIRSVILSHIKEAGSICKEDLIEFIRLNNESNGSKTNINWIKANSKYVVEFNKDGNTHYKLSKLGERVISKTLISE